MKRVLLAAAGCAALAAIGQFTPATAQMQSYVVPTEQANCEVLTKKLATGIEVIGASASSVDSARKSLETANQKMQTGQWYGCTTAARAGLDSLKAM